VRDLQQVELRQAPPEQLGIHTFLDVTGEQEPLAGDLAKQHDRDVVDRCAAVGRMERHAIGVRPQDAEVDRVERESIAGREATARRSAVRKDRCPRVIPRSRADHARFVHAPDLIPLEQRRQARDMVLMRMGEQEDVDPVIPRREALVEREEEPRRIGAAIDDHPAASISEHEDAVTLPDVHHDDVHRAVRPIRERECQRERCRREGHRGDARSTRGS
jgi:hypothetical protein